jgi:hypothetical protein
MKCSTSVPVLQEPAASTNAGNRALSTRIIILGLVGVVAVFFAGFAISRGSLRQQSIDREELLHQKREANLTLELKRLDVAQDSAQLSLVWCDR